MKLKCTARYLSLVIFNFIAVLSCIGQTSTILIDNESGRPIESALVIRQDSILSISDVNGLVVIAAETNQDIWISHISYQDLQLSKINSDTIRLERNVIMLDPVTIRFDRTADLRTLPNLSFINASVKSNHSRVAVPQLLNNIPGVFMHSGALNTNRITIRGIGSRNLFGTAKIKAYLNDIPLTNGVGETTIEDIDLSLIDNITVVKGPTSSLFGAGLGGMIHLSTRGSEDQNVAFLESGLGSYGLLTNGLNTNFQINESNRLIFHLNQTHSDGYRENNSYDRKGFSLIGEHELNPNLNLTFINNYIDLKAFIPSSLNEEDFNNNPSIAASNWQAVNGFEDYTKWIWGISGSYKVSNQSIFKASVFANDFDSYESRPFNILQEDNQSVGFRTTFLQGLDIDKKPILSIEAGLEALFESYNWQTFETNSGIKGNLESSNEEKRRYFNFFVNAHLDLAPGIHLQSGLNINTTSYDYLDLFDEDMIDLSGKYTFDETISPYFNINVDISRNNLSNELMLYGLISHGFSPPTLEETLLPDGRINPEIQPEHGVNFELGLKGKLSNKLNFSLTGYSMSIKDLLVARRTSADEFIGINAGKTIHNGIEFTAGTNWSIGSILFDFQSDLSIQDYKFKDFIDDTQDYSGNKLTGTPSYQFRTEIKSIIKEKLTIGIANYAVGTQYLRDDNSIAYDPYNIWNVFAKYKFQISKRWQLHLLGRVENLSNKKYASMLLINAGSFGGNLPRYFYPGLPRNYYLSVRVKHHF